MTLPGRTAALLLVPAALTLAGCVAAGSHTETRSEQRTVTRTAAAPEGGPELMEPPGGPFADEAPARPAARPAAPENDDGPQLMEPPGGRDVVVDGTPSRPLSPPPSAEPARARSGDAAYRQAVDCAGAMTSLLNSMTYAMSQNQADQMAYDQAAWRAYALSLDGRADKEIDRRAGQLNDITADRILRACPPAPRS